MSVERLFSRLFVASLVLAVGCVDEEDVSYESILHGPTSGPDLVETSVGDPPASSAIGGTFVVSDTVTNQGTVAAGATFTKYYLSSDGVVLHHLLGNRSVGALAAGSASAGSITALVPNGVPSGSYRIVACADSSGGSSGRISS